MMIYGGFTKYTKIVDFMSSGEGCLVIGRGHLNHFLKVYYFFFSINRHISDKLSMK